MRTGYSDREPASTDRASRKTTLPPRRKRRDPAAAAATFRQDQLHDQQFHRSLSRSHQEEVEEEEKDIEEETQVAAAAAWSASNILHLPLNTNVARNSTHPATKSASETRATKSSRENMRITFTARV